jgi:IclR family pca regulon transcriptional regulator
MPEATERDYIQSIERGFAVLTAFDAERPNPSSAELAAVTGLSRPAVRRILITLERLGYVRQAASHWALTRRVLTIGQHYTESHALIELAQPYLRALSAQTGESASLATLDGTAVVYVARVAVRRIMSINVSVGTRVPAYATSMGRVLLAFLPAQQLAHVLAETSFAPLTANTVTSEQALWTSLGEVRRQGWSIVDQELEMGLISASAPVRDAAGQVVAALASSTSSGRFTAAEVRERIVPKLVETAAEITAVLARS